MTRAAANIDAMSPQSARDAHLELAMRAARAERQSRPTYLLLIAALLLVTAIAALLWSWSSKSASETRLHTELALADEFVKSAQRLRQLESTPLTGPSINEPLESMGSRIQAAAKRANMTSATLVPSATANRDATRSGNARRNRFQYSNVHELSLEPLINWLNYAVESIPGLEVYSVTIRPDATGWNLNVTFTRWERTGS